MLDGIAHRRGGVAGQDQRGTRQLRLQRRERLAEEFLLHVAVEEGAEA